MEAKLRDPARKRHLSAFEASPVFVSGTRARAVRAASRGFAVSRAFAPAHALTIFIRPYCRARIRDCHCQVVYWLLVWRGSAQPWLRLLTRSPRGVSSPLAN